MWVHCRRSPEQSSENEVQAYLLDFLIDGRRHFRQTKTKKLVAVRDGASRLILRRETVDDLLSLEVR